MEYHFMSGITQCPSDLPSPAYANSAFARIMLSQVFQHSLLDPKIIVYGKERVEIIPSFFHSHKQEVCCII